MESSECHCYFTPRKKNESLQGNIDVIKKTCEQNTIEMVPSNDMTDYPERRYAGQRGKQVAIRGDEYVVKGAYITYPVYG